MPKYYRFRPTTPSRKPKRKEREKHKEIVDRNKYEAENNWLDLTIACSPAPSWYLRRIAWRDSAPQMCLQRQLETELQDSFQFSNRPIYVFKFLQRFAPKI